MKIEGNSVYLDLYWGRLEKAYLDYGKGEKTYIGKWYQRLLHIGPYRMSYKDRPKEKIELVSKYLNFGILIYDSEFKFCDLVYFGNYRSKDKSVRHLDKTNHDETVQIKLNKIRDDINYLVLAVNSFNHVKIEEIPYINLSIYLNDQKNPIKKIIFKGKADNEEIDQTKESLILGVFYKVDNDWFFKEMNLTTRDYNFSGLAVGEIKEELKKL